MPNSVHEIANQIIWNNIAPQCVDKKFVYRRDILQIWDLYWKHFHLFSAEKTLNPERGFFIMSIINSMPASWRLAIKSNYCTGDWFTSGFICYSDKRKLGSNSWCFVEQNLPAFSRKKKKKKQTTPTAKVKLAATYPNTDVDKNAPMAFWVFKANNITA